MPLPSIDSQTNLGQAFVGFNTGAEKPLVQLLHFLMRNDESPLSTGQRELIAAFISGLNSCSSCYGSHSTVAARFGVDPVMIKDFIEDVDNTPFEEKFKPILHYVKKLTLSPSKMIQGDIDKVLQAGWSERALYDAILICGTFNLINRYVDGIGLETHTELFGQSADRLMGGYDHMISKLRD